MCVCVHVCCVQAVAGVGHSIDPVGPPHVSQQECVACMHCIGFLFPAMPT